MYTLMYIAGFKTSTGYFLLYYKTSQAISQNMIEKAYYHRFYSRLFLIFILALQGYSYAIF